MKHAREVPAHHRKCGDNKPYLWYFDKPTQIGFEWTGWYDDPIEISQGGFGEPITNVAYFTKIGHRPLIPQEDETLVTFFHRACVEWLAAITADIHASEPQRVREVTRHG